MKNLFTHFQNYILIGASLLYGVSYLPTTLMHEMSVQEPETIQTTNSTGQTDPVSTDPTPPSPSEQEPHPSDNDDNLDDPADQDTDYDFESDLIIRAVNPGYKNDENVSNAGEFIELLNLTGDSLELAGYAINYLGVSSTTPKTIFTFPDGSYMTGKRLLLRFEHKIEHLPADLHYGFGSSGLAQSGGTVNLTFEDVIVNSICWAPDGDDITCAKKGKTDTQTVVRRLNGTIDLVLHDDYKLPDIDSGAPTLFLPEIPSDDDDPSEAEPLPPQCRGLEFSELFTYYDQDKSEQFIELFNPTSDDILLDGCKISYKNKTYPLKGTIRSGDYLAYHQSGQFAFTKNPKNPLAIALIDTDDVVLDEFTYSNGQKKSTSFAKIFGTDGQETWQITYAITPNAENVYQKFRNCEAGKIINEATGNCVKVTSVATAVEKLKTSSALAPCPAGKYRNPLTGRCKQIETASTLKECAEGYERNPETNRCRKIKSTTSNSSGADFAITPTPKSDKTVFVGLGIVSLIIVLGLIYIILQFRREIVRAARKAGQRLNHIREHLFTRKVGGHGDQKS